MARMTAADVLKVNNSEELVGMINQAVVSIPEIQQLQASPIQKTSYCTLVKTANPPVGFRSANTGRTMQTPTLAQRQVECKFLDASWSLDKAIADACEWGPEAAQGIQAQSHLEAALTEIAEQIWYGTGNDASGFSGVAELLDDSDDDMVVDAGGTTASTGSSLFAVHTSITGVQLAFGMNGRFSEGEVVFAPIYDGDGGSFWGYSQDLSGYVGLQLTNYKAIGRICNLTADSGKGLSDDLVAQLLAKFPAKFMPNLLFCSRRSRLQLQQSRTATNATGAPAPIPTEVHGIPLFASDAISDTEELLTAAAS